MGIDLLKMRRNRVEMKLTEVVLTVMTPMLNQLPVQVFQLHREKSTLQNHQMLLKNRHMQQAIVSLI